MEKIKVQVMAAGHELWTNRAEIRKRFRRKMRHVRTAAVQTLTAFGAAAVGYLLAMAIGALLTSYGYRLAAERDVTETVEQEPIHVTEPMERAAYGVEPYRAEAEAVAKVIYGVARNRGREGQQAVAWLIVNRAESDIFPDTVEAVCAQEGQWVGYSESNPVMEDIYQAAYEVLELWHSGGHRTIGPEYLWMNWSRNAVELTSSFGSERGLRFE